MSSRPRGGIQVLRPSAALLITSIVVHGLGCASGPTGRAGEPGASSASALSKAPDPNREACAGGDGAACERAADAYFRGVNVGASDARADAELFRRVCEQKEVAGACTALAWTLFASDVPHAIPLLLRACAAGSARACSSLGSAYEAGTGVPKDDAHAARMYRGSCDMGFADACSRVAAMEESGRGVKADAGAAAADYTKACDGGVAEACATVAIATGLGNGVPRDEARAAELFQKGCDGASTRACVGLGVAYAYGRGVAKDDVRAASLLKSPCSSGSALACRELANIYGNISSTARDDHKALILYLRACEDAEDLASCSSAATLVAAGRGIDADPARAAWLWTKACMGGNPNACTWLGFSLLRGTGSAKNVGRATFLLDKACHDGHATACDVLGTLFAFGDGVARDNTKAESLFRSACELGSATGCSRLGLIYKGRKQGAPTSDASVTQAATDCRRTALACEWLGDVPRERAEPAFKLLVQACDAEIPAACAALARAIAAGRVPKRAASSVMTEIRGRCEQGGKALWCRRLAFWHEEGLSVPKSDALARDFYKRACDGGDARACADLGRMLATGQGGKKDLDAAVAILKGACEQGGEGTIACGHLGMIYLNDGKPDEHEAGARLLERACTQKDGLACDRLGGFYAVGAKGFPKDERRAANLFELSCSYGGFACDEARRLREVVGIEDLR